MKKWSVKVFGIAAVGVLVCLLGMDQAGAWNQADLDKLLETGFCRECNLARANLREARLVSAHVQESNLGGADLSGANLSEADLPGADLSGADLSGADLSGADLNMAWWTDGRRCDYGSIGRCKCRLEGLGL
ncbi:pentapeptide repeat-containing protein [Desulfonatronovibrio magnus]|uniref:pentapeptide repeat-containing protein n=1 Tax=Desulfonatronovibrio magnus TaxID=698827 RepID=UPI0006967CF4|nr:pentapeptide repeat-containing protein [Desulfonatronovibrio magnus]